MGLLPADVVLECGRRNGSALPAARRLRSDVETAVRIFGEAVAESAAHPAEIAREAAAAGAMHEGEVAG